MWSSLLVLGFLTTIDPVRLGLILLLISRPRPIQNLFAYWAGCATAGLYNLLVPLVVLHVIPTFDFFRNFSNPAANSTIRHIEFGMGVLALSVAALMGVRFATRQQARQAQRATPGGDMSTLVLDSYTPRPISRLLGPTQDAATEGGSAIRRLLRRVRNAWENGSVWVAFVIGVAMGPQLQGIVFVLAIIVASGKAFAIQISAAIVFVFAMLTVEEIILVCNLAAPAKTQAFLRRLHDWALAHRRKLVVAIFAVVGVSLVAQGMGGLGFRR
jgi:hypothetical protein